MTVYIMQFESKELSRILWSTRQEVIDIQAGMLVGGAETYSLSMQKVDLKDDRHGTVIDYLWRQHHE